ncbi:MAG: hypothetical protein IJF56_09995 [Clostridia bacterium]|nr:hypothetical protein [Clostridia bacterium]
MKTNRELSEEYLDDAEKVLRCIRALRAERGPDLAGIRARRLRMLTEMYDECRVVGHLLARRERTV